jgi:hypothetical protein
VYEHVIAAIGGCNKAEATSGVVKLNGSRIHRVSFRPSVCSGA